MPLIGESSNALKITPPFLFPDSTNVSVGSGNTTEGPDTYLLEPDSSLRITYSNLSRVTASLTYSPLSAITSIPVGGI